jgi:hypothetical protein
MDKKIAPYLAYGIVVYDRSNDDYEEVNSSTLRVGYDGICSRLSSPDIKPLLYLPSCMGDLIETPYGKEIPILELFKMQFGLQAGRENIYSSEICVEVTKGDDTLAFNYTHGFCAWNYCTCIPVKHQFELYEYLYSRHIAFNLDPNTYIPLETVRP